MIPRPKTKQDMPENAQQVFKGKLFDVYQWQQEQFDGSIVTFEKLKRPDTVYIFPVLDNGKILILKEQQPGTQMLTRAIGGRVEPGEDILVAAKREFLEETGYEAKEFVLWKAEQVTPKLDWVIYAFIAKGVTKASDKHLDAGEKISLMEVSFDELLDLAYTDTLDDDFVIPDLLRALISKEKKEEIKNLFGI